jgi:hypothetical protein
VEASAARQSEAPVFHWPQSKRAISSTVYGP